MLLRPELQIASVAGRGSRTNLAVFSSAFVRGEPTVSHINNFIIGSMASCSRAEANAADDRGHAGHVAYHLRMAGLIR